MAKINMINLNGEKISEIKLNDNVFIKEPNDAVIYDAVVLAGASLRQGTHSTKTRSEVSGGGRKPWRQKGTGRARQGSIRATQWRGGGIVFGPTPRDYSKKMNKKERRLALKSALSYKVIDKELIVIDSFKVEAPKTSSVLAVLKTLNIQNNKVLIAVEEISENMYLAFRNLANVKLVTIDGLNTLDVVSADNLLITESALKKLEEVLSNE